MFKIVYVVIAVIISLLLAGYQYLYKNKSSVKIILFLLRFLAIFLVFLLLINLQINKLKIETTKPSLVVLTDNTKSILKLKADGSTKTALALFKNNKELNDKFSIDFFNFSTDISLKDTLAFDKNRTNIYQTLQSVGKVYKNSIAPIVLITDGNQTLGNKYSNLKLKQKIYPIIVGDTTQYQDIYISQLNVNKYAYLDHKFPVELFVNYKGNKSVTANITVTENNKVLFAKSVQLKKENNAEKIAFYLQANKIGFYNYKVNVSPIKDEKNKLNNRNYFSVDVINEQAEILIVSNITHPDIAMLKRSISSNKQRKVTVLSTDKMDKLIDYQLVIIYQPDAKFKPLFNRLKKTSKNFFIITGKQTDWDFLNSVQPHFKKKAIKSKEDYLVNYNAGYTTFLTEDLGFANFAPLQDSFGKISINVPYQSILFQQIGNVESEEPLLVTFENDKTRGAVLFGENSWRWRMSSKVEENSFKPFDEFMNKLIQYLSSDKKDNFLETFFEKYYYANEEVVIDAKYYDANYVFNPNAKLWITLINKKTTKKTKYPLALLNEAYRVSIAGLDKGNYSFSITDEINKNSNHGNFTVLDYNIEQQFVNSNKKDLSSLAINNNGLLVYPKQVNQFISNLILSEEYKSIQKSKTITSPLIDWKWILGVIILLLSIEWFIRKYTGYI